MEYLFQNEFLLGLFLGCLFSVLSSWIVLMIKNKPEKPQLVKESVWNRPEVITHTSLGPVLQLPVPAKRRFREFLTYLKDAEKADVTGDDHYRDHMLRYLMERLDESLKGKNAEE